MPGNATLDVTTNTEVILRVARWKNETNAPQGQVTGRVDKYPNMEYAGLLPRDVQVWLPPSYETATNKRYPVLYMHDGQQVFDPATSTHGIDWQVDETATRLIAEGKMQEIIIVAMNCTKDREEDYSDTDKGRLYADFIITKVKPFIDEKYRTMPDRGHTAVMGSSMGGRISFLLAWNHPEVFSMAGCFSSAFWGKMVKPVERYDGPAKNLRLYLDNGGVGLDRELQSGNDWMLEVLLRKGFVPGRNLVWFQDLSAEHNEAAWAKRAWMPLEYFFGIGEQVWTKDMAPLPKPLNAERLANPIPIKQLPALTVAGRKEVMHGAKMSTEIPALWEKALKASTSTGEFVGVSWYDVKDDEKFDYVAGQIVAGGGGPNMITVASNTYAVFEHRGSLSDLPKTTDFIYNCWIPRSSYEASQPSVMRFLKPNFSAPDFSAELRVPVRLEP